MCPHFSETWDWRGGEPLTWQLQWNRLDFVLGLMPSASAEDWERRVIIERSSCCPALQMGPWASIGRECAQPPLLWRSHAHPLWLTFLLCRISGLFCYVMCHRSGVLGGTERQMLSIQSCSEREKVLFREVLQKSNLSDKVHVLAVY